MWWLHAEYKIPIRKPIDRTVQEVVDPIRICHQKNRVVINQKVANRIDIFRNEGLDDRTACQETKQ